MHRKYFDWRQHMVEVEGGMFKCVPWCWARRGFGAHLSRSNEFQ